MPQTVIKIATISLILIAAVFYLVGFLHFRTARLTERNSKSTYGTLVGFRTYYTTDEWGDNFVDNNENKKGRVPIVEFRVNGAMVQIAAATANYSLVKDDIGKQVQIRYRQFMGIVMIIDDDISLRDYNQLQNTLFWVFVSVATIVLILGILASIFLPKTFGSRIL